jgi:hypothetical protein
LGTTAPLILQSGIRNLVGARDRLVSRSATCGTFWIAAAGGDESAIGVVWQVRGAATVGNSAIVEIAWDDTRGRRIIQRSRDGASYAAKRTDQIEVILNSGGNGRGGLTAGCSADGTAVRQVVMRQGAAPGSQAYLDLSLDVAGTAIQFGIDHTDRRIEPTVAVSGSKYQTDLELAGRLLSTHAGVIGSEHDIGVRQQGLGMEVLLSVTGNRNALGVLQGDALSGAQSVDVTSWATRKTSLTKPAGQATASRGTKAAAATQPLANALGSERRMTRQERMLQSLSLGVTGSNNSFGFLQSSFLNEINCLQEGDNNNAAVIHTGSCNVVRFEQRGSLNILGVVQ